MLYLIVSLFASIIGAICGIGGGPINLVVLYFFFSMTTKEAASNSIFVILFGQITNLGKTMLTHNVPRSIP